LTTGKCDRIAAYENSTYVMEPSLVVCET